MISMQTRAELTDGALDLVQQLVRDYLAEGPTEAELERSKREIAGSFRCLPQAMPTSSVSWAASASTTCR